MLTLVLEGGGLLGHADGASMSRTDTSVPIRSLIGALFSGIR